MYRVHKLVDEVQQGYPPSQKGAFLHVEVEPSYRLPQTPHYYSSIKSINTSLAAKGALANHLQRLQNPKWPPGGPKMAEGVWKGVYP